MQVAGNSTANLIFDQRHMTGDVLVDDSSANITLQNRSQFIGRLDKVNGVTINSQSNWTLTVNDMIGPLAMSGGVHAEKWQVHADFDYAKGEHIEQPLGGQLRRAL